MKFTHPVPQSAFRHWAVIDGYSVRVQITGRVTEGTVIVRTIDGRTMSIPESTVHDTLSDTLTQRKLT